MSGERIGPRRRGPIATGATAVLSPSRSPPSRSPLRSPPDGRHSPILGRDEHEEAGIISASVRVASWNLLHGLDVRTGRLDLPAVAAAVDALDVDVLAVQEVDRELRRSGRVAQVDELARLLGWHGVFAPALLGDPERSWSSGPGGDPDPGGPAYGIGLLARRPLLDVARVALPGGGRGHRSPESVGALLPGWDREPRVALRARVTGDAGAALTVTTTHLSFQVWRSPRQLRAVLAHAAALRGPAVVLGDLNLPWPLLRPLLPLLPMLPDVLPGRTGAGPTGSGAEVRDERPGDERRGDERPGDERPGDELPAVDASAANRYVGAADREPVTTGAGHLLATGEDEARPDVGSPAAAGPRRTAPRSAAARWQGRSGTGWAARAAGPTYPAWRPGMQLDHVLGRDVRLDGVRVGPRGPSDHLPIRAVIGMDGLPAGTASPAR